MNAAPKDLGYPMEVLQSCGAWARAPDNGKNFLLEQSVWRELLTAMPGEALVDVVSITNATMLGKQTFLVVKWVTYFPFPLLPGLQGPVHQADKLNRLTLLLPTNLQIPGTRLTTPLFICLKMFQAPSQTSDVDDAVTERANVTAAGTLSIKPSRYKS